MSTVLWRIAETLLIMYGVISYVAVIYALFVAGGEKAKMMPMAGRVLFSVFAPIVLIVAVFMPLPKKDEGK